MARRGYQWRHCMSHMRTLVVDGPLFLMQLSERCHGNRLRISVVRLHNGHTPMPDARVLQRWAPPICREPVGVAHACYLVPSTFRVLDGSHGGVQWGCENRQQRDAISCWVTAMVMRAWVSVSVGVRIGKLANVFSVLSASMDHSPDNFRLFISVEPMSAPKTWWVDI